uniref:Uncharacterized protein n=1 Tax=Rhizophora mucronata TaxID=61149 RepID=A0A2P2Q5T2_RHIMU
MVALVLDQNMHHLLYACISISQQSRGPSQ